MCSRGTHLKHKQCVQVEHTCAYTWNTHVCTRAHKYVHPITTVFSWNANTHVCTRQHTNVYTWETHMCTREHTHVHKGTHTCELTHLCARRNAEHTCVCTCGETCATQLSNMCSHGVYLHSLHACATHKSSSRSRL